MKTIAIAGGLLAAAALLTGCGLGDIAGPSHEETASYQVTDKVTKLQLKSNSGEAVITETDGSAVRVVETLHWRGDADKPKPEHKVEGEGLFLSYACPSDWGSCSVDYKIEVPKGLSVDLDAGSGNLTLRNLTGQIDLHAGSGDVDATGLAGKKVYADVGSGNLDLTYTAAPDAAELKTGSGDITLNVPDGAYDVKTDVGSGDTNVTVKKDAGSAHRLSLSAGSGDITVKPA
ncbi:DUF4097 family beta strand repeat-containing protein [Nonomuraea gerenzanensis]|uniref:Lipoprotein n=1 Tax=Nonomuraea gerenzanensis TaxID=93944 RepID=A0A1M4E3T3_9ACTN|nr:DUF4097 family beta strand repeat-containing protein [Nonomuraea gerenzanensis]UBU15691.1 DUF4097 domain-containing protein [Nonomuraea gerenzanensis]SBO93466.1 lipoprotein [Nonomuraea gerenzanensis]